MSMVKNRYKRFDIDSDKRNADRSDIPAPTVAAGANAGQRGRRCSLVLLEVA